MGNEFLLFQEPIPSNAFTMGGIVKDAGLTVEELKKLF